MCHEEEIAIIPEFDSPFPDWVAFGAAAVGETELCDPHPEEIAALSPAAVDVRRVTFALGRIAARRALEALGHESAPILPGRNREPIWPAGLVGSISHTADRAVAAVAAAERTAGVGLDIEEVGGVDSTPLEDMVADKEERRWIAGDPTRFIRVFSAKEAIFKAFYPRHGAYFGFEAVHLDPMSDGFVATLRLALADSPAGSRCIVGSRLDGRHILSAVLLPPLAGGARMPATPCLFTRLSASS